MQKPIEPIRWRDIGNLAENLGVRGSVDRAGIDHGVSMLNALEKTRRGSDFDGRAAFSACDRSVSFTSFQRGRYSVGCPLKSGTLTRIDTYSGLKTTVANGGIWKEIDAGRP